MKLTFFEEEQHMNDQINLEGKRILAVDDEPDVLDTLEEILSMCRLDTASSHEKARDFIENNDYDAAVLDIMGVRGYDLLELCREKGIPTLMLTAYALSPDHLVKSIEEGALAYVPKEKMMDLPDYISEILIARRKGIKKTGAWFARLRPFFYEKFGSDWREQHESFVLDFETVNLILVPTDFSLYSCEAFPWAAFFAKKFNAAVVILHVISKKRAENLTRIPGNPWERILETEDKQMIQDFSACLVGDFGKEIEPETRVEVGDVADRIVAFAREREASMTVMSTHGRSGLIGTLIGGVAERVLRRAPCPVFSVKPKEMENAQS
jgi:nucleotide-binding universal stress UspA family protein/CheY-like chemotaxis protein